MKRIAKRGRDFENGIDIKFVEGQRLLYEKWIDRIRSEWKCSINTFNTDLVSIEELGESVLKEIII